MELITFTEPEEENTFYRKGAISLNQNTIVFQCLMPVTTPWLWSPTSYVSHKMMRNRCVNISLYRNAQVEARKAELLVEIRELLSASVRQTESNVGKVNPFMLIDSHRERMGACLQMSFL